MPRAAHILSKEQVQNPGNERAKAAEIEATMELDVTPTTIGVGESYAIKVHLTPTNDKPFRLKSVAYSIRKNAQAGAAVPVALQATTLSRGQKGLIAEINGTWEADVNTWVLEVRATTERGDVILNSLALRKN